RLATLQQLSRGAQRQIVFFEGEPGIGKTSLVQKFLAQNPPRGFVAVGRCIENRGTAEPYMPVLGAIDRLARSSVGGPLVDVMRNAAPALLAQMPWLVEPKEARELFRLLSQTTQARLIREITHVLEWAATETELVLVLEDLHWSDEPTLQLLQYIAQRPEPAHLMVMGTYRAEHAIAQGHPLLPFVRGLQMKGQCTRLALEGLGVDEVERYCADHLGNSELPTAFIDLLQVETTGNPLYLRATVDHLQEIGWLIKQETQWHLTRPVEAMDFATVPGSIGELIETQLGTLGEQERTVLQAASVVGVRFSVPLVAAALNREDSKGFDDVEETCLELERRRVLSDWREESGVWPDGTHATAFAFPHALHHRVVYRSIAPSRRRRYHQRVGERLEAAYGSQTDRVSQNLAMHFEASGDAERAVRHHWDAARIARGRSADHEAIPHLRSALKYLVELADGPLRRDHECRVRLALGLAEVETVAGRGEDGDRNTARVAELTDQLGDSPESFFPLLGLWQLRWVRGDIVACGELASRLLVIAEPTTDALRLQAHAAKGMSEVSCGHIASAEAHLGRAIKLSRAGAGNSGVEFARLGMVDPDPIAQTLVHQALVSWLRGFADHAVNHVDEMSAVLDRGSQPFQEAACCFGAATVHCWRGDIERASLAIERVLRVAREHDVRGVLAGATIQRGWIQLRRGDGDEGTRLVAEGFEIGRGLPIGGGHPLAALFVIDALRMSRQVDLGLSAVERTLSKCAEHRMHWLDAELHRLRGEFLLLRNGESDRANATKAFQDAIADAQQRGTKALELRARTSLVRERIRASEDATVSRRELEALVDGFSEGLETADLREARQLIAEAS
ncbi:MAG: AAA family ATPase, partial [Polyangiales bacterium]